MFVMFVTVEIPWGVDIAPGEEGTSLTRHTR